MIDPSCDVEFLNAVHSRQPVAGLTHGFYRYPARFSPLFARAVIEQFTKPGDVILDPFMGGGTTLVEARVSGRRAIGVDINALAVFVARVKTASYAANDLATLRSWVDSLTGRLNLHSSPLRATEWVELGYQRNINGRSTWPIRKTLELALARTNKLPTQKLQRFCRCALLKTAQWLSNGGLHVSQESSKTSLIVGREMPPAVSRLSPSCFEGGFCLPPFPPPGWASALTVTAKEFSNGSSNVGSVTTDVKCKVCPTWHSSGNFTLNVPIPLCKLGPTKPSTVALVSLPTRKRLNSP